MKISLEIAFEHAVGFLSDPYRDVTAPSDFSHTEVIASDECIAFMMRPYFDGGAVITISSVPPMGFGTSIFASRVLCESGVLSLSDSNGFHYCMIPVLKKNPNIEIWADKGKMSEIYIYLSSVREF